MGSGLGARKGHAMDRRQRKTRQAIYAAFEGLMAEQHYSEVTVAQVIKRADIGRSTFYAHFETKDELLNQMCVEMFTHIFEGVDEHCVTHATLEAKDLTGMLAHLLYHLRDTHHSICGKLLGEGEPHFTAYFKLRLADLFTREMPKRPNMPAELATELLVAAFCQEIAWWVKGGYTYGPEQIAQWFQNFTE